jgi:type IV secretory pathway component VirB8
MEQVRVNLSLEQEVWERFSALVPNRKKSKIINELLKKEVKNIIHRSEEKELRVAFQEASKDTQRIKSIKEWEPLDAEGWD